MTICMAGLLRPAEDIPPGPIDQQSIQHRLHSGKLAGNLLAQRQIVSELLRLDTADNPLGLRNQAVQLLIGTDVEMTEPLEELLQVINRRVPKDFGLAILLATEPMQQHIINRKQSRKQRGAMLAAESLETLRQIPIQAPCGLPGTKCLRRWESPRCIRRGLPN